MMAPAPAKYPGVLQNFKLFSRFSVGEAAKMFVVVISCFAKFTSNFAKHEIKIWAIFWPFCKKEMTF